MYAIVAPGFSAVYDDWKSVERIKSLYPYPKWTKCSDAKSGYDWIKRNAYGKHFDRIYNYGDTFNDLYAYVKYKIMPDCIYYIIDTKRIGHIRIMSDVALVEYKGDKVLIKYPDIYLSSESISGHMSVIYNLLQMLGPYIDINIEVPYYSIFYCLALYSEDKNRYVTMVRNLMDSRVAKVAVSLDMYNMSTTEDL